MKKLLASSLIFGLLLIGCSTPPATQENTQTQSLSDRYVSTIPSRGIDYGKALNTVAFGSCAHQGQPQPIWSTVAQNSPELFLAMGDNIYASLPHEKPISSQYRILDQITEYRKIRSEVPFLATWDDHDFGERDGGADFIGKQSSQIDFMNYWTYMKNSIPLEQAGIYHSKVIGPKKQAVQVIMLDTRFHRTPLLEKEGNEGKAYDYLPSEGTLLGETQWQWLEEQFKRPADLRLIVSSIQLIADDPKFEKWGNFPKERERFFALLKKYKIRNAIILSGDRHIASIAKMDIKGLGTLYEVTASSLNRPSKYTDADSHYIGKTYSQENFGLAHIDWKKRKVKLEVRNMQNEVVNQSEVTLPKK